MEINNVSFNEVVTPAEREFLRKALNQYRFDHLCTVYTFTSTGEKRVVQPDEWFQDNCGDFTLAECTTLGAHEIFTLTKSTVSV